METKMITIPFDVELAHKIEKGMFPGKIVARNGFEARVVCWDKKGENDNIVALIQKNDSEEICCVLKNNGFYYKDNRPYCFDLLLKVPEWSQFKDGDIIICEVHNGPNDYCKWYSVLKGAVDYRESGIFFQSYATYCYDSSYEAGKVSYDVPANNIGTIRGANEFEKDFFIERLKEQISDKGNFILKNILNISVVTDYEYHPFEQVLVRDSLEENWNCDLFSHRDDSGTVHTLSGVMWNHCIPYNEKTKHLLGTIDNWEGE